MQPSGKKLVFFHIICSQTFKTKGSEAGPRLPFSKMLISNPWPLINILSAPQYKTICFLLFPFGAFIRWLHNKHIHAHLDFIYQDTLCACLEVILF